MSKQGCQPQHDFFIFSRRKMSNSTQTSDHFIQLSNCHNIDSTSSILLWQNHRCDVTSKNVENFKNVEHTFRFRSKTFRQTSPIRRKIYSSPSICSMPTTLLCLSTEISIHSTRSIPTSKYKVTTV